MHLPLSAMCILLVAVPVLVDVAALRHPAVLVQGKRELQLQRREGVGNKERREGGKKSNILGTQSSQQLQARLVGESLTHRD